MYMLQSLRRSSPSRKMAKNNPIPYMNSSSLQPVNISPRAKAILQQRGLPVSDC
jgi:hypothetical protein